MPELLRRIACVLFEEADKIGNIFVSQLVGEGRGSFFLHRLTLPSLYVYALLTVRVNDQALPADRRYPCSRDQLAAAVPAQ